MFVTMKAAFRSKQIHIGMDEAWGLGTGKYLAANGLESVQIIMKKHLDRVCALAEKYDYEVLMWSDMFFANVGEGGYYKPKIEMPKFEI